MSEQVEKTECPRIKWLKQYGLGLGVGAVSAAYGVIALLTRHAWLPGLRGENSGVVGTHGLAVATAYLTGGLYLVLRFFVHPRSETESGRGQICLAENFLLLVLIGCLVYVLLKVGTAG